VYCQKQYIGNSRCESCTIIKKCSYVNADAVKRASKYNMAQISFCHVVNHGTKGEGIPCAAGRLLISEEGFYSISIRTLIWTDVS
jgi:hypothetical protein